MAVSRLGLIGVGRERYSGFLPKTASPTATGVVSRLGLMGVPRERYATNTTHTATGAVQAQTATVGSGIASSVSTYSRLGLMGVPREGYRGFVAKTPTSGATRTASGTPQAQTATVSATVYLGPTATGAVQADTATVSASVQRVINADGSLRSWARPLTNASWFAPESWFINHPLTQRATATNLSTGSKSASGSPQAQTATVSASISRTVFASGTPQAQTATCLGISTLNNVIGAAGAVQADTATCAGNAVIPNHYAVVAQTATCSGVAFVFGTIGAAGNVQADTATCSGSVIRVGYHTIIANVQAETATVTAKMASNWRDSTRQATAYTDASTTSVKWDTLKPGAGNASNWSVGSFNTTEHMRSIWYDSDSDLWVACGDGGKIYTRSGGTGSGWTERTSGTAYSLRTVKKWNGAWYICGYNGTLLRSFDAINWSTPSGFSPLLSSSVNWLVTMAFSDDKIVVGGWYYSGGYQGIVYESADGGIWSPRIVSGLNYVYGIAYDNSQFGVVGEVTGDLPGFLTTSNFTDYTTKTTGHITGIWTVDYDGVNWITGTGNGEVRYSANLVDWFGASTPDLSTDNCWRITHNNQGDVLLSGGYSTGKILKSTDNGQSFSLVYENESIYLMSKAIYGPGYWMAVGWSGVFVESITDEVWSEN